MYAAQIPLHLDVHRPFKTMEKRPNLSQHFGAKPPINAAKQTAPEIMNHKGLLTLRQVKIESCKRTFLQLGLGLQANHIPKQKNFR